MRILSISHSCVISEYQKRLCEVCKYSDVELTLLVPKRWVQFNKEITLEKEKDTDYLILSMVPITWGFRQNRLRNITHIYPNLKEILGRFRPNIVELWEEPFSAVAAHTVFWTKRTVPRARVIFFSAQNVFKRYPFPFSAFEKYTHENAAHAFLVNEGVGDIVRRKGFEGEFTILPLGVDTSIFYKRDVSSLKERLGIRGFTVGFIGKIARQKGILHLIEAVSQIQDEIHLLIIGNGAMRNEADHLITSLGLRDRTIIIDAVAHRQVPDYLNCMDLLVLPSITLPHLKEQFGRVIIEAMACEVPVIGSDSGEIPATIGKAGLIFKEKDITDLKGKIEALIRDKNLRAMLAKNGRKRVLDKFSWKVIAKKQHQVYTRLMSRGK